MMVALLFDIVVPSCGLLLIIGEDLWWLNKRIL
jgi:hypothetical protein